MFRDGSGCLLRCRRAIASASPPAGAGRRSPIPRRRALRAGQGPPSGRSGEGPARRDTFAAPRRDQQAPRRVAAPRGAADHQAGGTGGPRPVPARPGSPPRGLLDDAVDRAGGDSPIRSVRPAPSGARDAPRRPAHGSPGSDRSGPGAAAPAAARAESSGCGLRSRPRVRPRRVASPRGLRRTPAAGTFPRKRGSRLPAPTGRVAPGPPAPRRPRGPPPGTARRERRDRARDAARSRPAAPARPRAAAPGSAASGRGQRPAGCPRRRASAGRGFRGRRRALGAAGRPRPPSAVRARRPCRPRPGTHAGRAPRAAARPPGFGLAVHSPPAAHDALHVAGRARAPDRQQACLRLRRRHAGQGAHLGVGQLATSEGLGQAGQCPEGARHPDSLAGGAQVEAHAPAQPVGAGAEAVFQPPRASKSRISASRRAVAASRCADSSAISSPSRSSAATRAGAGTRVGNCMAMTSPPSTGATLHPGLRRLWRSPRPRDRVARSDFSSGIARP